MTKTIPMLKTFKTRSPVYHLPSAICYWLFAIGSFVPCIARAEDATNDIPLKVSIGILGQKQFANVAEYVGVAYQYLTGVAGIIAIAMIMYAGMKWIFAAGDASKISRAKETIVNAVVGLVLALGAYIILNTINPALVKLQVPEIDSVDRLALLDYGKCPVGEKLKTVPCGQVFTSNDATNGFVGKCVGQYCAPGPNADKPGCFQVSGVFRCVSPTLCPSSCNDFNTVLAKKDKDGKPTDEIDLPLLTVFCESEVCKDKLPAGCRVIGFNGKQQCRERNVSGGFCSRDTDCPVGQMCNLASTPQLCNPAGGLAKDVSCNEDRECLSGICNKAFVMDQCTGPTGSVAGEPCVHDKDCGAEKNSGLVCRVTIDPNFDNPAGYFLEERGQCTPLKSVELGGFCDRDGVCTSGTCNKVGDRKIGVCK